MGTFCTDLAQSSFHPNSHRACDLQRDLQCISPPGHTALPSRATASPGTLFSIYNSPAAQVSSCLVPLTYAFDFFEISVPGSFYFLPIFYECFQVSPSPGMTLDSLAGHLNSALTSTSDSLAFHSSVASPKQHPKPCSVLYSVFMLT